jgi:hypothetical protein
MNDQQNNKASEIFILVHSILDLKSYLDIYVVATSGQFKKEEPQLHLLSNSFTTPRTRLFPLQYKAPPPGPPYSTSTWMKIPLCYSPLIVVQKVFTILSSGLCSS